MTGENVNPIPNALTVIRLIGGAVMFILLAGAVGGIPFLNVTPPNSAPGLPAGRPSVAKEAAPERRELWPWVAALGLVLLMAEWLYSQRIVIRRALVERRTRRALQNADNGQLP